MKYEIKRLSVELIDDYLHFFDITPHSEQPNNDDCKCYCVWWCSENQDQSLCDQYLASKEGRRLYAATKIAEGKIRGYLAYSEGKVVGWCNANQKNACYNCYCWRNFMGEVKKDVAERVKSVFCFAVSPEYRRKGIATSLLETVCTEAKAEGFDYVEAYPNRDFQNQAEDFMGAFAMYEKAGFYEDYLAGQKIVMRKKL